MQTLVLFRDCKQEEAQRVKTCLPKVQSLEETMLAMHLF